MRTRCLRLAFLASLIAAALPMNASALEITPLGDAQILAQRILGPGITLVGTPVFSGSPIASGLFSDGLSSDIGIGSGIILTSGKAADAVGPNHNLAENYAEGDSSDDTGEALGLPGDTDLDLLSTYPTFDASVLEFDFETAATSNLAFRYVFASEEYIDYVTTEFNDVFGLYLDGVNIGVVPGSDPPAPITINTINPFSYPTFYINNVENNIGLQGAIRNVEYDGFTTVITAQYLNLPAGIHHMKIAVADASDGILDSAVFIEAGSFTTAALSVDGPSALAVDGLVWTPNPFTVTAYLHNWTSFPVSGDALTLALSGGAGLELAAGETASHSLPEVPPGETVQTSWQVMAVQAGTWGYLVRDTLNTSLVETRSVFVPNATAECQPALTRSCATGQPGACQAGLQICGADGLWGECIAPMPLTEVCDDGIDNDCDGQPDALDDDCWECTPDNQRECTTGRPGVCSGGTQTCGAGGFWEGCVAPSPVAEACGDGIDNDCDGQTDALDRDCWECTPQSIRACATGQPGFCSGGIQTCGAGGFWDVCVAPSPVAEVCGDGIDNDCDGQTDALDGDCASFSLDCGNAAPNVATLWPPNNKMAPIAIGGVIGQDGTPATITVNAIFQDELDKVLPDAAGIGQGTALIRAERLGGQDGRVYTIEFTAVDSAGGTCRGTVSVCVPHDKDHLVCVDSGTRHRSTK